MDFGGGMGYDSYADEGGYNYNEAGGFDGGSQGGGQSQSQTPRKGNKANQTLVPVTVKQLTQAMRDQPDDVFRLDGKELHQVKTVGMIVAIAQHSTYISLSISDGTGQVDVRHFMHGDDSEYISEQASHWREGVYVKVFGNLRSYQDQVHLASHCIRPLSNMNELTCHFLQCIHVHLINTRGVLNKKEAVGSFGVNGSSSNPLHSMHTTPIKQSGLGGANGHANAAINNSSYSKNAFTPTHGFSAMSMDNEMNFSIEQQAVLDVLSQVTSDTGMSIDEVMRRTHGRMSERQVRDAIVYLTNEGHVYSTIDEDHYKRTE